MSCAHGAGRHAPWGSTSNNLLERRGLDLDGAGGHELVDGAARDHVVELLPLRFVERAEELQPHFQAVGPLPLLRGVALHVRGHALERNVVLLRVPRRRVRLADREPMAIERVEIAAVLCPGLERFDLAKDSLYEVLDREYRVRFTRCEQVVSASIADARQRKLLHIGTEVALLNVTRRSFTNADRPASCGITQYRGDLYTASVPGERRGVRRRR